MATLQQQARALGDPTRHSVFRYLATSNGPVDVAELAEHLGFHHNAIRQHLTRLVAAELVIEDRAERSGPGRPRLIYSIEPSADSRWGVTGPYERLSLLLTEVIRSGDSPREVGRRAGSRMRQDGDADTAGRVCKAMAEQGFEPEVRHRRDGVDVLLRTCPFESSAIEDPATVCQLHLGLAEGLVGKDDDIQVEELIAKDPRRANCRLKLRASDLARP